MQRIMIIGASGSGKSCLARAMSQRLGLPAIHLDREHHLPGWVARPPDVWRTRVVDIAANAAWIIDGSYSSTFAPRLARAQAVIWLDLPRHVYFPRTMWRLLRYYGRQRPDSADGCRERFDLGFFRDWVWTYPDRGRPRDLALMARLPPTVRGIVLHSPRAVRQFVAGLPHSLDAASVAK